MDRVDLSSIKIFQALRVRASIIFPKFRLIINNVEGDGNKLFPPDFIPSPLQMAAIKCLTFRGSKPRLWGLEEFSKTRFSLPRHLLRGLTMVVNFFNIFSYSPTLLTKPLTELGHDPLVTVLINLRHFGLEIFNPILRSKSLEQIHEPWETISAKIVRPEATSL